eukprot:295172_1
MLPLLVIFGIIYPSTAKTWEYSVCNGCTTDTDCWSEIPDIEECVQLGNHFEKVCYWKDSNIIDIDADTPPRTRKCSYDKDCEKWDNLGTALNGYDSRFSGGCLRCCNKLCVETLSTSKEPCGAESVADIKAPCCPGEVCLDNYTGICAELVGECDKCFSFAMITDTADVIKMGDNCMERYFCLTNNRIKIEPELQLQQIFYDGVCIPETRISESVSECTENEDCPPCLRCCKNQCVRANGENCGFKIDGRGPCCCPEDKCKLDECIINTESPTPSPSQTPSQTPITQQPVTQQPITQQPSASTSTSPTKDD